MVGAGVVGWAVLALLGPPVDRPAAEQAVAHPQVDRAMEPARTLSQPVAATPVQPEVPVVAAEAASSAPRPPSPAQTRPLQTSAAPALPIQPPPAGLAPPVEVQAPATTTLPGAPPRGRVLVVLHPARPDDATATADRLAARAGLNSEQVEVGTAGEARSEAAIRFYSEGDHALARRLGKELAGMKFRWRLENYSQRAPASTDQAIDVWLPR